MPLKLPLSGIHLASIVKEQKEKDSVFGVPVSVSLILLSALARDSPLSLRYPYRYAQRQTPVAYFERLAFFLSLATLKRT